MGVSATEPASRSVALRAWPVISSRQGGGRVYTFRWIGKPVGGRRGSRRPPPSVAALAATELHPAAAALLGAGAVGWLHCGWEKMSRYSGDSSGSTTTSMYMCMYNVGV